MKIGLGKLDSDTQIISSSWHLLVGGIYYPFSENSVLKIDVLEAGEMGNPKDLSNLARRLGPSKHQGCTMEQRKKVAWSDESRFLLHHLDGQVCVLLSYSTWGNTCRHDAIWEEGKAAELV